MFFKARKAVRTFLYLFPWFVVFSSFHCFLNWQLFVIHRYLVFQTRIVLDRTGTFSRVHGCIAINSICVCGCFA